MIYKDHIWASIFNPYGNAIEGSDEKRGLIEPVIWNRMKETRTTLGIWRRRIWITYLLMNAVGAGLSVFLYLIVPAGSVKFFGGDQTSLSAASWCSIVGAGDLLVSFLAFVALLLRLTRHASVMMIVAMIGIGLYSVFHSGAYLYSHLYRSAGFAIPSNMLPGIILMFFFGILAVIDASLLASYGDGLSS